MTNEDLNKKNANTQGKRKITPENWRIINKIPESLYKTFKKTLTKEEFTPKELDEKYKKFLGKKIT